MTDRLLTKELLTDLDAQLAIGCIVANELQRTGQITVFLNIFGNVQIITKEEQNIELPLPIKDLNSMAREDAVRALLDANAETDVICNYLRSRDSGS